MYKQELKRLFSRNNLWEIDKNLSASMEIYRKIVNKFPTPKVNSLEDIEKYYIKFYKAYRESGGNVAIVELYFGRIERIFQLLFTLFLDTAYDKDIRDNKYLGVNGVIRKSDAFGQVKNLKMKNLIYHDLVDNNKITKAYYNKIDKLRLLRNDIIHNFIITRYYRFYLQCRFISEFNALFEDRSKLLNLLDLNMEKSNSFKK